MKSSTDFCRKGSSGGLDVSFLTASGTTIIGSSGNFFNATFDATGGKSIAAHNLGPTLPNNARIISAWYRVNTTFTSATDAATISLGVETAAAAGLVAAVAISDGGNPWDASATPVACIPDFATVADWTTATSAAGKNIIATVAVEALTAGKLTLWGYYTTVA
jgi:hypothetical protein